MGRKRTVVAVLALVLASIVSGCGGATGVVRGQVLVFGPVVPAPGTPPTSTPPTARFDTTVGVRSKGRLVTSQPVLPGSSFRFVLPAGSYVFSISPELFRGEDCRTPANVRPGRSTTIDLRCVLP